MPAEMRTRLSVRPIACRRSGRHRRVGHRRRVADERLHAAEALGERHQLDAVADAPRVLERPDVEREHPAESVHLPLRRARAADGWAAPDRGPAAPSDAPSRNCASARPFALCCAIRTASVLVPRSTSHESNGLRIAPRGVLNELAATRCPRRARRRRRRRRCRCGRSGTWSCCG